MKSLKYFTGALWLFLFLLTSSNSFSQSWSPLGGGTGWGNALAVYNGELIAGGAYGILRWDGSSWNTLGSGVNAQVDALCVYNGELYAGGRFTIAGGVPVSFIASWNGTAWSDPEGGTNSYVVALTVYNNALIVGGYFTSANGPANHVAKWDGSNWSPLGAGTGGTQGQVMALTVYNGSLIAGGFFSTAGGQSANRIAAWNGTSWSPLSSGIGGIVYALTIYNGDLIAGGLFSSAGGNSANDVASWNGTSWSPLGSGCSGGFYPYVFGLTTHGNDLYVGGLYTIAGGITSNGIAKWNGSSWSPLGSGFWNGGSNVFGANAVNIYNNELIATGIFSSAGGNGAANIAKWNGLLTGAQNTNSNTPKEFKLYQNYPNPFNPSTAIKYSLPKQGFVKLIVYDMLGKEVKTLVNEIKPAGSYEKEFDASGLASGVYFYTLSTNEFTETKKMMLTK